MGIYLQWTSSTFDYNASSKKQYMNVVWCIDGLQKQLKALGLEFKVELYILGLGRSYKNPGLKVCGKFWWLINSNHNVCFEWQPMS